MNFYKLIISYKGTRFSGWQKQSQGEQTIQGHLEECLFKLYRSNPIKTLASGRTDAGVHALEQTVKLSVPHKIPENSIKNALNGFLDCDIRVLKVESVEESFHPIRDAHSKEYLYFLYPSREPLSPLFSDFMAHIPYELNILKIQKAAKMLEGNHDFCNYYTTGSDIQSTKRQIYACDFLPITSWPFGRLPSPIYRFRIRGEGFLKQMIRLLIGTLINIGVEKVSLKEFSSSLQSPLKKKLGSSAPACGLYLAKAFYDD